MYKILLGALTTAVLTSCASTKTQRMYIGTKKSPGIFFADLDTGTGKLTTPKLAAQAHDVGFITISPDNQHLYSTGVAAFKINPDGSLTQTGAQKTKELNSCHVSTDHSGNMLMTAYYSSGAIASFKINTNGSLTLGSILKQEGSGAHPKRQTKPHAHSIYPNPDNTHAYAADLGTDEVMIYAMDLENGKLMPAGSAEVPGGSMGPRHMKWNTDGSLLYVLNELDLSVSTFQSLENGQLKFLSTISILPENTDKKQLTAAEIRIHPNGKFIYTSIRDLDDQGRDSITQLKVTDAGLTRIDTAFAQVSIPRNFNIDPTGKWLIVGGQRSQNIAVFSIDNKSGRIEFTGQKIDFEGNPICFEFVR